MSERIKIAVSPPIQLGGSLFTSEQLIEIGRLVGPEGKMEMTPFKQLYLEIPSYREEEITQQLRNQGLEVNPSGFVTKSLIACNFCKGAEEAGLDVARQLNKAISGMQTPSPLKIGYAGCALGTSEPLLKDISVVKMRNTFDIYVGGEPKGIKASFAQLLLTSLSEDDVVSVVSKLVYYYKEHAKGKEKFSKFVQRISIEHLKNIAS
ncbi:nitrite and sulphite reductase 4Fe-4S domain protein [Paenibacillus sp. oral taxon 786 str. D14]|uniref:nitrite reductase n=1 Tax=Paenibacillus sp. oral taxon 786 TaxID=652715 RepID=UPI0001AFCF58|nr:nitrite reductase [Paenibacillus sp. oral taxon 786]EES73393.1 nitrite and sulphite reductase 4Fe-4S domain protein [Paenibacillus sp. oral taxon 786 str. D14]